MARKSLLALALAAMMLVAASAGPTVAHSKKHRGKKGGGGGSSARCASTFPGCRTCRTVAGEYTCVTCKLANAVFDTVVPDKCVCNSDAGWGQFDQENWDLYREAEGLTPSRPPASCVECERYPGCAAGVEGECVYGGDDPNPPTPTATFGRRLFDILA